MRFLRAGLRPTALLLACLAAGPALAGPWEARTPQGMTLTMSQSPFRNRDAFMIERRYPDKTLDAAFAQAGVLVFKTGPDNETPGAMRVDAAGRIWVAGASTGPGDLSQAVVLRFLSNGAPDTGWAEAGRSATAPAGRKARAQDLLPLPDGGAWVAGQVENAQGLEQAGWWRLRPDGRVDPAFGLGGLWVDGAPGATEVVDLAVAPDGSAAVALRRGEGPSAQVEAWVLAPGATAPQRWLTAPDEAAPRLAYAAGRWGIQGAAAVPTATAAASAAVAAASSALGSGTALSPNRPSSPGPVASAAGSFDADQATSGTATWWWIAGLAGAAGLGVLAVRRGSVSRASADARSRR